MIKIINIEIRNFLSIGNAKQSIRLDKSGLILVLGENIDTGGNNSRNGAGKTALLQAILFALYGVPLTQIKMNNLVNAVNDSNLEVSLEFEKNGNSFRIERGRKPNYLRWIVDDHLVTSPDSDEAEGSNKWTQSEIQKIIEISPLLFKHLIALNTYTEPFLSMGAALQRQLIEELLGITILTDKSEKLKELMRDTKEQIGYENNSISTKKDINDQITSSIKKSMIKSNLWNMAHRNNISNLQQDIINMKDLAFDQEIEKLDVNEKTILKLNKIETKKEHTLQIIESQNDKIRSHARNLLSNNKILLNLENNVDIIDKQFMIKSLIDQKNTKLVDITEKQKEITKLNHDLETHDSQTCVTCGQPLDGTDHLIIVINNIREHKNKLCEGVSDLNVDINSIDKLISTTDNEINDYFNKKESRIKELKNKINAIDKKQSNDTLKLTELNNDVEKINEDLSSLPDILDTLFENKEDAWQAKSLYEQLKNDLKNEKNKVNPFQSEIETLKSSLQEISYDQLNALESFKEHQEVLYKLLTNKDSFIRKSIIDQNIQYLNNRLSYYLELLGLPHQVKFLNDLSVEIIQIGRDFDFAQLSRGERNRLILGLSWSFRDVWETTNQSINLLFIDELMDSGIDGRGSEAALGVLKNMYRQYDKNIFLVSHKDNLITRVSSVLNVKKEDGFTSFSYTESE